MKDLISHHKFIFGMIIFLGAQILMFVLLLILRINSSIAEWWTLNISKFFVLISTTLTSVLSFSITEMIFVSIFIGLIVLIVYAIISLKKSFKSRALLFALLFSNIIMTIPLSFMATQGMSYNRKAINISLYNNRVNQDQYLKIVFHYLDDFNECQKHLSFNEDGSLIMPYTLDELSKKINEEYKKENNNYYFDIDVRAKNMTLSRIYTEMHITGLTYAPHGDVCINTYVPSSTLPFTLAHELAHIKGVSRENDAQLSALNICLKSNDYYIRYSAYMNSLSSLLLLSKCTGNKDDYKTAVNYINETIKKNITYENNFWNSHNKLVGLANFFNNLFLKSNGETGTSAYDDTTIIDEKTGDIKYYSKYQKLYFSLLLNK